MFEGQWQGATGISECLHKDWVKVRNQLIHGKSSIAPAELEQGCVYLCEVMSKLAVWGLKQSIKYDGLANLSSIGLPTYKTAEDSLTERLQEVAGEVPHFPKKRWEKFKAET